MSDTELNSAPQLRVLLESGGLDLHEPAHRASREVHRARVGAGERGVESLGTDANHQFVADDSECHRAVDEERDAAESACSTAAMRR